MPSSAADASTLTSLSRTASAEGFAFLFQTRASCLSRVTTPGPGLRPPPLPAGTPGILWFNHRRLHGEIGLVPPVEFKAQHYHTTPAQHPAATRAGSAQTWAPGDSDAASSRPVPGRDRAAGGEPARIRTCLLYTSDAADEEDSVDL